MTNDRLVELLNKLTLEEKCAMLSGKDFWRTFDVPRLGIPSVKVFSSEDNSFVAF
jgi:beta-glucosidase